MRATLQRLAEAGFITINARALRPHLPDEDSRPQPLSDEERSKVAAFRDRAHRKVRAARALLIEDLAEDAAACLADAAVQVSKAWSVERHWDEPATLSEAANGPYKALWTGDHAAVAGLAGGTSPDTNVLRALCESLGRLAQAKG
jgi:hypothetical protein